MTDTNQEVRETPERCIACDERMRNGDAYLPDADGGVIHAACCGPERESYVDPDGEPLRDGDPLPKPRHWIDPNASATVEEAITRLGSESWSMICKKYPTAGGDDGDVGYEVISYHMAKPTERVEGMGISPLDALRHAGLLTLASAPPPAVPDAVGVRTKGLDLSELRRVSKERQDVWCPDQLPDLSFRGNELAGETGEVCNVIKKLERERLGWRGSRDTVEHLAEELADVVICADLAAMSAGIDLSAAVVAKFNATSEKVGLPHRLSSIEPTPSPEREAADAYGWLYHNPDTGTEWAPNHPIESGEVHDAEDVRAATAVTLQAELVSAWRALAEEPDLRRSHIVSSPEVEVSNAETVNTVVNFNELDDLFSRIPGGPYHTIHSDSGWEVRQIDVDPTNRQHWPFRLCQSVSGQMAVCDGATFEFIAAILNIWPTFRAALSTIEPTPSPEPQASNAGAVEYVKPTPEPQTGERDGEVERLRNALVVAKRSILEDTTGAVACVTWVPQDVCPAETLVDHIDAALRAEPEAQAIVGKEAGE